MTSLLSRNSAVVLLSVAALLPFSTTVYSQGASDSQPTGNVIVFSVLTFDQVQGFSMECVELGSEGTYLLEAHPPSRPGTSSGRFYKGQLTPEQLRGLHALLDSPEFVNLPVEHRGMRMIRDEDALFLKIPRGDHIQEGYVAPALSKPARALVSWTKDLLKSHKKDKGDKTGDKRLCPRTP